MKRLKNKIKEHKAITLIALVITIIVLLILAGITIAQLSNSGLFEKAKLAKEKYKNSQEDEEDKIAKYSNEIDSYVGYSRTGGSTINYSTSEQDTGMKWINNKPIYQKTRSYKMPSTNSNTDVNNFFGITNADQVISLFGFLKDSGGYYAIFHPWYSNRFGFVYNPSNDIMSVQWGSETTWAYNQTAYVTIQYTKTTD